MTAAHDILRAETLERAAHDLATRYTDDRYLQPGLTYAAQQLRLKAQIYRAHAAERTDALA